MNTYSLQLSFYRLILERNTDLKLGESYIVWFNENNNEYKVMTCYDFRDEILKNNEKWVIDIISKKDERRLMVLSLPN